jgi:hypothetical protein
MKFFFPRWLFYRIVQNLAYFLLQYYKYLTSLKIFTTNFITIGKGFKKKSKKIPF